MLERWISSGRCTLQELVECFDIARSLKNLVGLFGWEKHPSLEVEKPRHQHQWRKKLSKLFYRMDKAQMFENHVAEGKINKKRKECQQRRGAKLIVEKLPKTELSKCNATKRTMRDHFVEVAQDGTFYLIACGRC